MLPQAKCGINNDGLGEINKYVTNIINVRKSSLLVSKILTSHRHIYASSLLFNYICRFKRKLWWF
jgi:hypothetical protein